MRNSKSKPRLSMKSERKNSAIKLNADIESSLLLNKNRIENINNFSIDNKDVNKIKRDNVLNQDQTHDVSFLENKFIIKNKENSQRQKINLINNYSCQANKSNIKYDDQRTSDSRTFIQKTNENNFNVNNTNSINTEKFDKSYTSYIIKSPYNQKNSMDLTNDVNLFIKSNSINEQKKANSFNEKNSAYVIINESSNYNYFDCAENKEEKIINNSHNDGMFVTSTVVKLDKSNGNISSRRHSKANKDNIIIDHKKENSVISSNDNNRKDNQTVNNDFKYRHEEIITLNKIIENEMNKRNKIIEYCGLGSRYNKINSFDIKFNKDLAQISKVYGKIESRNKFSNKEHYDELIQEAKDFQTYRNIKVVNEKNNYRFRLMPLINNKKNSFEILANNFFLNIKNQKESPEYLNIDEEFENYMKNKYDKEKYISIFEDEIPQI